MIYLAIESLNYSILDSEKYFVLGDLWLNSFYKWELLYEFAC